MPHTDTSKSQATKRTSCHAADRHLQITGNKSYFLPCLTQIPATNRQQVVHLCHASHRYQQITGSKSYILPCLTQIPANHRQQIFYLAMPHTDTCKSQAPNHTSYHASHRCQQHTGNKSYILQCSLQIPENHRPSCQQILHLAMPHAVTSKSQATNRTSCHASHRYLQITSNQSQILPCLAQIPANHRQQIAHLTMPHTDISKYRQQIFPLTMPHTGASNTPARNRTSYHASHRNQQITGNKSYILPCLKQITNSKSQATSRTSYHASHRYQQITGNKSYILPCLTQIPANHRQQIVHLAMPHTDTCKSQAASRASYHASHKYQQIIGNKSYFLPCLTQIQPNHRQQIFYLAMPHTDTTKSQATSRTSYHESHTGASKSQATNRTSYHASHRCQKITGNKS